MPLALILLAALAGPAPDEAARALGDPDWRRREEAEQALLAAGEAALPALQRAVRSEDREVALRARALLDQLDPEEATFRILRLESRQALPFAVPGCALLSGRDGAARGSEIARDGMRPSSFTVKYRTVEEGLLWVDAEENAPGTTLPLISASVRPGTIRILKRACLSVTGPLLRSPQAKDRVFSLTIECRSGRRSQIRREPWPLPGSAEIAGHVTATIRTQIDDKDGDPILRDEAAELARFLGLAPPAAPPDPRALVQTLASESGLRLHLALLAIEPVVGDPEVRDALARLLVGPGSGQAPWDDPALERIGLAWARARGAAESLASFAEILAEPAGRSAEPRSQAILRIVAALLADADPPAAVVDRLVGAVPGLLEGATLRSAIELLAALPTEKASDEAIRGFFEALDAPVGEGALAASAAAQAARAVIARMLPDQTGRLRESVEILIRHARAPQGARTVVPLLEAITGVSLSTTGRPSPALALAAEGRWRDWLADPAGARRYLEGQGAQTYLAEFFDLWVPGGGGPEILGAARIRIAVGRPAIVRTSGGNLFLASLVTARTAGFSRLVLHDVYGQTPIPEDRIDLLSPMAAGSVRYEELSDRSPASVPRYPPRPDTFRIAVRLRSNEDPGPFDPAAAWSSAIASLVRALPDLPEIDRTRALSVVTSLGAREAEDDLAAILDRTHERAYAYALAEIGSRKASAFLRDELRSSAEERRVRAAQALATSGDPAGVDALLDAVEKASPSQRGPAAFAIGRAFETGALGLERQADAIHLLIERLDAGNASSILPVLRRITGISFDAGDAADAPAASAQGRRKEIQDWKAWWASQAHAR